MNKKIPRDEWVEGPTSRQVNGLNSVEQAGER